MWLHGFGFPRYKGGVMFWADTIGAREIYNQIAAWHQRYGGHWKPSRLLQEVAEAGGKLSEVKGKGEGESERNSGGTAERLAPDEAVSLPHLSDVSGIIMTQTFAGG